jgi:PAS domain S-box-containing protein
MATADDPAATPPGLLARMAALRRIALAVVRPTGPSEAAFLHGLLAEVTAALPADGALVAVFGNAQRTTLRTLAARLDGQELPDFEYPVQGSPCQRVVGLDTQPQFRYFARGVLAEVDPGSDFAAAGLDAYAAFPLTDAHGAPLGVLAALARAPIAGGDADHAELVLNVVAGRLAGELERRQAMNVLRDTALAVSSARGETIFDELVRMLAASLELEFAFVARHESADPDHLTMVALYGDGRIVNGLRYAIAPTPCRTVLGQQFRVYPADLAARFPDDPDVLEKGAESYAGMPLTGTGGDSLGVIAVGSRRPLRDVAQVQAVLELFAVRAGAEIERLRALEGLRRSEASYRAIFDSAASAIFVHDWDTFALLDANRRACEDHGRTREELLSAHPEELMAGAAPYDLAHAVQRLQQARLGHCPPFEWQVRVKDGRLRWWEIHLKPAQLDGRPCILAFSHDITARKAAEQLVRASEEQHRSIFNASVDGMLVKDADNRVVDVNEAYLRMHGFTRDELVGSCLLDRLPAPLRAQCKLLLPQVMAGTPCHFEAQTLRRDGSLLDVEIHGVRVVYGGQVRALVIMRDITERKRTEARLRASEAQYRAMFDVSDDALMLWDGSLKRVDVNRAHQVIFGYEREDVVGRAFEGLDWPAEMAQQRLELLTRALAGEASRTELEALRKDGRRIHTELRTIPFMHRGEPHVLQIARDVTERVAAEARLRESAAQYRAIFEASADALILWDRDYRRVDVNAAYQRLYGWSREEVVGRGFEVYSDASTHVEPRRDLVRRALAGESCRAELEGIDREGRRIVTEIRTVPFQHRGEPHVLAIARDITERTRAEEQLRASEEQYRAIFNTSADAIVLWDVDARVVDVNRAYTRIYGFERDEVIGNRLDDWLPPAMAAARKACMRAALAGEERVVETTTLRKNGEAFDVELRYFPIRHRGEPHVLAIGRDITERKNAEAKLRQSEEQYRAIFNASEDAMVLWNDRLQRVDVNAAHQRLYGFARDEVLGRAYEHLPYQPELAAARLDLVRRAFAGESCQAELQALRRDGSLVLTEVHAVPFQHRGTRHVLTIARDISERKKAESALRAREQLHRALFDTSVDAMALFDRSKRLIDVNPAFARIRGKSREELAGRPWPRRNDIPGQEVVQGLVERALAGHEAATVMNVFHQGDGVRVDMELRYLPVHLDGEPFALGIGRNVTERLALESQLRQAQKMEAIGQLTGGIAHDFNNILTSVLGYVAMAEERAEAGADERLLRQLGQARLATERARDLVAQMLAFAQRRGGKRQPLAPAPLVRESVELLRSTLPSSLLLEVEGLEDRWPDIDGDSVQLSQVLMNLVINARDAVGGTGRVRVRLGLSDAGDRGTPRQRCSSCGEVIAAGRWLAIDVVDNGCGIAPDVVRRMFDPFFSTKPAGRGTGMGLAMVHGIVHDHGGHIAVQTGPGEGSTFSVLLPVRPGEAGAGPRPEATGRASPHPSPAPAGGHASPAPPPARLHGRVLLVEDDPQAGDYLRERLEAWGLEVVLHRDPREALRWLDSDGGALHLLITDLTMPHRSGLQLAGEARARRPGLPVLLISGDLRAADAAARRAAGIGFTLAKPLDAAALRDVLTRALVPPR